MDEEKQPSFCLHLQDVKRCENLGYPGPRNLSSHGFFRIPRTYMHL